MPMQEFVLSVMNSPFLSQLACRLAAILAVRCRQTDTDAALVNLEPQPALSIVLRELAQLRVFFDIREKTFL